MLVGFIETLQTLQLLNAERARYLGLMAQGARMHSVVQDLLTLAPGGQPFAGARGLAAMRALLVR